MAESLKITIDVPPYPAVVKVWSKRVTDSAEAAERFYKFLGYFVGRETYDCRVWRNGEKVDGEYYDGPLRMTMWEGTEEERRKGFFTSPSFEHDDNPELTHIRPWTCAELQDKDMFYVPKKYFRLDGHYLETDPAQIAYDALMEQAPIGECSHIFMTTRTLHNTENAVMFFPITWGNTENLYLVIQVCSRYNTRLCFLFQGNPEEWGKAYSRGPRSGSQAELDIYFSDTRSTDWPESFPAPNKLSLERLPCGGHYDWEEPRAIRVTDYTRVVPALGRLLNEHGERTIYGGG